MKETRTSMSLFIEQWLPVSSSPGSCSWYKKREGQTQETSLSLFHSLQSCLIQYICFLHFKSFSLSLFLFEPVNLSGAVVLLEAAKKYSSICCEKHQQKRREEEGPGLGVKRDRERESVSLILSWVCLSVFLYLSSSIFLPWIWCESPATTGLNSSSPPSSLFDKFILTVSCWSSSWFIN